MVLTYTINILLLEFYYVYKSCCTDVYLCITEKHNIYITLKIIVV